MRPMLFAMHMATSLAIAVTSLYLPGHKGGLPLINCYFFGQAVLAGALVFMLPRRQIGPGIALALAASAWGFCCALVAAMSLGNAWL